MELVTYWRKSSWLAASGLSATFQSSSSSNLRACLQKKLPFEKVLASTLTNITCHLYLRALKLGIVC